MDSQPTFYELLQVPEDASPEMIRMAYRALAARHHPDRNPENPDSGKQLELLNAAYEVLSDPMLRRQYDVSRQLQAQHGPAGRGQSVLPLAEVRPKMLGSQSSEAIPRSTARFRWPAPQRRPVVPGMLLVTGLLVVAGGFVAAVRHQTPSPPVGADTPVGEQEPVPANELLAARRSPRTRGVTPFVPDGIIRVGDGPDTRYEFVAPSGETYTFRTLADATLSRDTLDSQWQLDRLRDAVRGIDAGLEQILNATDPAAAVQALDEEVGQLDDLVNDLRSTPVALQRLLPSIYSEAHERLREAISVLRPFPELLTAVTPVVVSYGVSLEVGYGESQLWRSAGTIPEFAEDRDRVKAFHRQLEQAYGPIPARGIAFYSRRTLDDIPDSLVPTPEDREALTRDLQLIETARNRPVFAAKLARRTRLTMPADLAAGELTGTLLPLELDPSRWRPVIDSILQGAPAR